MVDLDLRVDGQLGFSLMLAFSDALRSPLFVPIQALGHALEEGRESMHIVVAIRRLAAEPKLPPLNQDSSTQWAENLAAKSFELCLAGSRSPM